MATQKVKNQIPVPTEKPRVAKAVTKYIRIAPRKMRVVIDTVRFAPVHKAFLTLMSIRRKAARIAHKVLKSAVANAKNIGLDENRLYISDIRADGGPMMKRYMARSMGRAEVILKRMTHLSVTVKESDRPLRSNEEAVQMEKQEGSSQTGKKKIPEKKKTATAAAKV